MNHQERQLMRLLHGELTPVEAARLEAEIERDDALRATYERLAATWQHLELPEPAPPPTDFADGVKAAAIRQQREPELSWALAPTWARAGAAVALTTGMVLGMALGSDMTETSPVDGTLRAELEIDPLSLAEIYWLTVDDQEQLFSETAWEIGGASAGGNEATGNVPGDEDSRNDDPGSVHSGNDDPGSVHSGNDDPRRPVP